MGRGKSYCTSGMLYFLAASCSSGAARAQSGHCRSSNTSSATFEPFGGFSTEVSPPHTSAEQARASPATNTVREKKGIRFIPSVPSGAGAGPAATSDANLILTELAGRRLAGLAGARRAGLAAPDEDTVRTSFFAESSKNGECPTALTRLFLLEMIQNPSQPSVTGITYQRAWLRYTGSH